MSVMRMNKLHKDYQHIEEAPVYRPVSITVCTSAPESNVRGFLHDLKVQLDEKIDDEVRYLQLPYNEVEDFNIKNRDIDVMILCVSIHNRRFAVTDVPDAVYTKFLPKVERLLGKEKIAVIVHDMPREKIESDVAYESEMRSFREQQPTTFRCANLVQIGGQMAKSPAEVRPGNWAEIKDFVAKASRWSAQPPAKTLRDLWRPTLLIFAFLLLVVIIGLTVGLTR